MNKYIKEIIPYVVIILVVIILRTFVITPVQVDGSSMYPTLKDNQVLILKKYDKSYKRFDIVVLKYGKDKLVKRVIGVPGDIIKYEDNKLYVNGKYVKEKFLKDVVTSDFTEVVVPDDHYFVMGDNRENSKDSRIFGVIKKDKICGTVSFSIFPFNRFGKIK